MRHLQVLRFVEAVARTGSLRRAAAELNITPSALNRRILALERELGVEIFERLPHGMRPNTAGELLLGYIRRQFADLERVRSRIADLSGMRAGHVRIAATAECLLHFVPDMVRRHVAEFPGVTFELAVCGREEVEERLRRLDADLALALEPVHGRDLHAVLTVRQRLWCLVAPDHPLAGREMVRLWECAAHPLVLPRAGSGTRLFVERLAQKLDLPLAAQVEAGPAELPALLAPGSPLVGFAVDVALPPAGADGPVARPVELRGVGPAVLAAGQLRGRALSVAASRFLEVLVRELAARFEA